LFSLILACIASDIGGFIFGKYFKGPKLTKISPKKTVSGALGSLIFTTIIYSGIFLFYKKNFDFNIILVGLLTSMACQFGDLFFSFLKRKARVKDTGNFFPGHGGVLDRLDGILVGVPFGFIIIKVLF
jgi:phosphatidate cytidylyltransferase